MSAVGFTTTVPVEIILAAGKRPVDLNNLFIGQNNPLEIMEEAERLGFPTQTCSWIKGIYAVAQREAIRTIIAVDQGDCSNSRVLMELLELAGIEIVPFSYPADRDSCLLRQQMERLMARWEIGWEEVNVVKDELDPLRRKLHRIDELTWRANLVDGHHNHLFLVQSTDMRGGDPVGFEKEIDGYLAQLEFAVPIQEEVRLGYIGVPPIWEGLHNYLEAFGARIVYHEVQRQFSLPSISSADLVERYRCYTYPYGIWGRIRDIREEIAKREIQGLIHYVQAFCFRQLEDIIFRRCLGVPILTVEGDKPIRLDMRTKTRLEAFVELLRGRKDSTILLSPHQSPKETSK